MRSFSSLASSANSLGRTLIKVSEVTIKNNIIINSEIINNLEILNLRTEQQQLL